MLWDAHCATKAPARRYAFIDGVFVAQIEGRRFLDENTQSMTPPGADALLTSSNRNL